MSSPPTGVLDQRCALALNVARQQLMHLSLAEFKDTGPRPVLRPPTRARARDRRASSLVPEADTRSELLKQVRAIASAGDPLTAAEDDRLARLSRVAGRDRDASGPRRPGHASVNRPDSCCTDRDGADAAPIHAAKTPC